MPNVAPRGIILGKKIVSGYFIELDPNPNKIKNLQRNLFTPIKKFWTQKTKKQSF